MPSILIVTISVLYVVWGVGFHRLSSYADKTRKGMVIDILLWPIGLIFFAFDSKIEL